MSVTANLANIYEYTGSLANIMAGGLLSSSLINTGSGSMSGQFIDNNGQLTQLDDGQTTVSLAGGAQQSIDYLGAGTVATIGLLGITLDSRPVMVFQAGGKLYLYAPSGLPLLSGVSISFNVDANASYNLTAASNSIVEGLDTSEAMNVGYTDLQGDAITTGNDIVYGYAGNDTISTGSGSDAVYGGEGADQIQGDTGADAVYGDGGNDTLSGGAGTDVVFGGIGDDLLFGNAESDQIFGGDGTDSLYGGDGDDLINGGAGSDSLFGDAGADTFVVSGADTISDFDVTTGLGDEVSNNNDFVDLSGFYNDANLAVWNAEHPNQQYVNPLEWMRADQSDNGTLDQAAGLKLQSGGLAINSLSLLQENTGVICFATGTRITTSQGMVAVEDLEVGDLVLTYDNGYREIRWIGSRRVSHCELKNNDNLCPVAIRAGSLGYGLPDRDLVLTRQHRVLVKSPIAEKMFGSQEVIIPAKDLRGLDGVASVLPSNGLEYWHVMFDDHEIILAENSPTESFYFGPQARLMISDDALQELRVLFPNLSSISPLMARPEARGQKARQFAERVTAKKELVFGGNLIGRASRAPVTPSIG